MKHTAESVSPSHPDICCNRIAAAILDEMLKQDPESRTAIEVLGGHNIVTICGEVTTNAYVDIRKIVKRIAGNDVGIQINLEQQSLEIAQGVDKGGAGDSGICVGYACNENDSLIPQELYLAKSLCKYIYDIHPEDGKTQITIDGNKEITDIVCSFCNVLSSQLRSIIFEWLNIYKIKKDNINIHINPAGDWSIGGFAADSGCVGRKLAVDSFGPRVPVGGGEFTGGKDPSKVDKSGVLMARKRAIELLKDLDAKEVLVKVAYGIGIAEPIMVTAEIDGKEYEFDDLQKEKERFKPNSIIKELNLKQPIYEETACWGPFGNKKFPWEIQ